MKVVSKSLLCFLLGHRNFIDVGLEKVQWGAQWHKVLFSHTFCLRCGKPLGGQAYRQLYLGPDLSPEQERVLRGQYDLPEL